MHFVRTALVATLYITSLTACGGDDSDAEPFDTFQACVDDHHMSESLPVAQAITVCCLDHPIGGQAAGVVCGADSTSCVTYVTAQFTGSDATTATIQAACDDYQSKKGQ